MKNKTRVYYNSACPVCKRGIEYEREQCGTDSVDWLDLHADNTLCREVGQDLEYARKYLHITDSNGEVQIGIEAFILLWRQVPSQRWLATLFSLPLIRPIAKALYFLFANALYRWNRWLQHW